MNLPPSKARSTTSVTRARTEARLARPTSQAGSRGCGHSVSPHDQSRPHQGAQAVAGGDVSAQLKQQNTDVARYF